MIFLAKYILKGYSQAGLVAATMAMLGLLLPPVAWISGATVALVTLVKGHRAGLLVTLIAAVGTAMFAGLIFSVPLLSFYYVLLVWLPLVLLAMLLRHTVSMVLCLQSIAAVSLLAVIVLHQLFPDFGEFWREPLEQISQNLVVQSEETIDEAQLDRLIDNIVRIMPGLFASSFMIGIILSLYLARWWQAVIYNPGGFGKEFRAIDLGKSTALITLAIVLAGMLADSYMFNAMLLVVFALYLNQGVAVMHAVFAGRQFSAVWLYLAYLLMLFIPHIVVLLAMAGFADTWIDIRRRLIA